MNGTALDFALQLLKAMPLLIQAGTDVADLIAHVEQMQASGEDPSPGMWDDLNARIAPLRDKLHSDDD